MKATLLALSLGLVAVSTSTPAQASGVIENACMGSERPNASRALCSCIQNVADAVLSNSDQRRGAKFFADPHLSQETRASASSSDESFWLRWRQFGATASEHCR